MQEIMDALKRAGALLSNPDANRKDRSTAIAALEEAQRRLDTLLATLKAQRRWTQECRRQPESGQGPTEEEDRQWWRQRLWALHARAAIAPRSRLTPATSAAR